MINHSNSIKLLLLIVRFIFILFNTDKTNKSYIEFTLYYFDSFRSFDCRSDFSISSFNMLDIDYTQWSREGAFRPFQITKVGSYAKSLTACIHYLDT